VGDDGGSIGDCWVGGGVVDMGVDDIVLGAGLTGALDDGLDDGLAVGVADGSAPSDPWSPQADTIVTAAIAAAAESLPPRTPCTSI
jgi:hypothetical protein